MWGPTHTPARVLVVDDNADTAQSLCWLLQSFGYEVRTAYTGGEAIEQARTFLPDAILLDVGLPDISGFEVAARLRATPEHANTLLIVASGYNRERDRAQASEVGIDHYLVKPFDPRRVDQLLAGFRKKETVAA